jgi:hypothetical protein
MVYEHGVGVKRAGGLAAGSTTPALVPRDARRATRTAASDLVRGARHLWQELRSGRLAPTVFRDGPDVAGRAAAPPRAGATARGGAALGPEVREEMRRARLYTDLVLAADGGDAERIDGAIEAWGAIDAPRIRGESLLELVLGDEMPPAARLRLVRALLRFGAAVSERAVDRAAATGDGRVFGPVLDARLEPLDEAERERSLRELGERLFHSASNLRRVVRRRRNREALEDSEDEQPERTEP